MAGESGCSLSAGSASELAPPPQSHPGVSGRAFPRVPDKRALCPGAPKAIGHRGVPGPLTHTAPFTTPCSQRALGGASLVQSRTAQATTSELSFSVYWRAPIRIQPPHPINEDVSQLGAKSSMQSSWWTGAEALPQANQPWGVKLWVILGRGKLRGGSGGCRLGAWGVLRLQGDLGRAWGGEAAPGWDGVLGQGAGMGY